tara:strand:- start:69 stop:272 length:204 start_codon:yes stop_codon:yes gene_type:complete
VKEIISPKNVSDDTTIDETNSTYCVERPSYNWSIGGGVDPFLRDSICIDQILLYLSVVVVAISSSVL